MSTQSTPATDGRPPAAAGPLPDGDEALRDLALKQIERKRHFQTRAFGAAAVAVFLIVIWAITEYNNAGGWPTSGFSQSSSIPHEWNDWIIYPIVGIALFVAIDAWQTYRRRPISEPEIQREMDRMRGAK